MSTDHKSKDHTIINIGKKSKKCIFRVPNVLRRQNPEAYTPDIVSIGPFHYREKRGKEEGKECKEGKEGKCKEDFQLMERVKKSYFNEILAGMNITLEELTTKVTELSDQENEGGFEERARNFYAEPLYHICSKDFIKMMIVDGCFLIQLFRKCDDPNLRAFDDPVFDMDCMFHFLCHDILLLENQLPWFVIHILYDLTHDIYPDEASLSLLVLEAFNMLPSLKQGCSSYVKHLRRKRSHFDADYLHILDLVRNSIVIPSAARKKSMANLEEHEVDSGNKHERKNKAVLLVHHPDLHQIHTATALSKADIKFETVEKESILDIQFKEGGCFRNGILQIPPLNVGMSSETLFRNLIAIEQCYRGYSNEITSYAIFMDNLICSNEDMELLCKQKVIRNFVSHEDGCKFFCNLYKDIPYNEFYYAELCKKVNDRYRLRRYTWKDGCNFYFPKVLYVFVAIILLQVIPTILQTTFTIKQYYYPQK